MKKLIPGDVIRVATGIHREIDTFVVHGIHEYPNGAMSLRARYASNPRGVDWSLFVPADEPTLELVARGVAKWDTHARSMLSGD